MNRIDRLFATILLLQRKERVTAQALGETFGISKRTVYRDVSALLEMGVPIISLPGEGYELEWGYFLPPLLFSPDEAGAIFLAATMLRQQAAGQVAEAAEAALGKITAVLPPNSRRQAEDLVELIQFVLPEAKFDLDNPKLRLLQKAIRQRQLVHLHYYSYSKNEQTQRDVEPHRLFYSEGIWYVNAYCRLRQEVRAFRVNRIESLHLLPTIFTPRPEQEAAQQTITAVIQVDGAAARWVRERQHYAFVSETAVGNGSDVQMTYAVHRLSELVPWILSWGSNVHPLSPSTLRDLIQQEITILKNKLT